MMGYWAKIQHGKKVRKAPLPQNNDPNLDIIEFLPPTEPLAPKPALNPDFSEVLLEKALACKVPERVHKYHPAIRECRSKIDKKYTDRYGHVSFNSKQLGVEVKITKGTVDRSSRFLHSIIQLFSSLGWPLKKMQYERRDGEYAAFVYGDEELKFKLKERIKQKLHEKSEKEKQDRYFWGPKYDYIPTGELEFSITNIYGSGFKTQWKDTKRLCLEQQIPDIVKGCALAFEHNKQQSIEREKKQKLWKIEEAKRAEEKRLRDIEEKRRQQLFKLVDAHKTTIQLRELISALEASNQSPEFKSWLDWASTVANSIDPTKNHNEILNRFNQVEEEPKWHWD